jgi:hypothetical protein
MGTVAFDTHEFVKSLKSAGFQEAQAEVLATQLKVLQESGTANLATRQDMQELQRATRQDLQELQRITKQDIKELATATKQDLKELELRIENKLESMRGEITLLKWMMGFVLAGIVSLVLKAFFFH